MNSNRAVKEDIKKVLRSLKGVLKSDTVTSFVYDMDQDAFGFPVWVGIRDNKTLQDYRMYPRGGRAPAKIVKTKAPIIAKDAQHHPLMSGSFVNREGIKSSAGYPLVFNDKVLGVLFTGYKTKHEFEEADHREARKYGEQAAEIIFKKVFSSKAGLKVIDTSYGKTISDYQSLSNLACDILDRPVALWISDQSNKKIKIHAGTGLTSEYLSSEIGDHDDYINRVFKKGDLIAIRDVKSNKSFKHRLIASKAEWQSSVAYPIKVDDRIVGVIEIFSFKMHDFNTDLDVLNKLRGLSELSSWIIKGRWSSSDYQTMALLAERLGQKPKIDELRGLVARTAQEITAADLSLIYPYGKDRNDAFHERGARFEQEQLECLMSYEGKLIQTVIEKKELQKIDDTEIDADHKRGLGRAGIRSLILMPLQMESGTINLLYLASAQTHHFSENHVGLLNSMAHLISTIIGKSRLLFESISEIDETISYLSKKKEILNRFCRKLKNNLGFEYVTISLIRPEENIIEAAAGVGIGEKWKTLARHYLEKNKKIQDIQASIVLSSPPRTEIISGWDDRFDEFIYREIQHGQIARITAPILLFVNKDNGKVEAKFQDRMDWKIIKNRVKTKAGQVLYENNDSAEMCYEEYQKYKLQKKDPRQHTVLELSQSENGIYRGKYRIMAIGTIGAGYPLADEYIRAEKAMDLNNEIAANIDIIRKTSLNLILRTIVDRARQIVAADSASLHFNYLSDQQRYVYELCSGSLDLDFLNECRPPFLDENQKADRSLEPIFSPDPHLSATKSSAAFDPKKAEKGIMAEYDLPLRVNSKFGYLCIYWHNKHYFSNNEREWLQLFAERATEAIELATTYEKLHDRNNQLSLLIKIAHSIFGKTQKEKAGKYICSSTRNLFAADFVCLYVFSEDKNLIMKPLTSGKLIDKSNLDLAEAQNELIFSIKNSEETNLIFTKTEYTKFCKEKCSEGKHLIKFVRKERFNTTAIVLLKLGKELEGVLFLYFRRRYEFSEDDLEILEMLAPSAAMAICFQRSINIPAATG